MTKTCPEKFFLGNSCSACKYFWSMMITTLSFQLREKWKYHNAALQSVFEIPRGEVKRVPVAAGCSAGKKWHVFQPACLPCTWNAPKWRDSGHWGHGLVVLGARLHQPDPSPLLSRFQLCLHLLPALILHSIELSCPKTNLWTQPKWVIITLKEKKNLTIAPESDESAVI